MAKLKDVTNLTAVCHHCGEPMPESKGRTPKKYCGATCRKAAQRARAKPNATPPAPVIPLPTAQAEPADGEDTQSPWRLGELTPAVQLEMHMERIERLLDVEPSGLVANNLAKTWLDGFKLLQTIAPAKAEEGDPIERTLKELRAGSGT